MVDCVVDETPRPSALNLAKALRNERRREGAGALIVDSSAAIRGRTGSIEGGSVTVSWRGGREGKGREGRKEDIIDIGA